jgi:hypothetical protein
VSSGGTSIAPDGGREASSQRAGSSRLGQPAPPAQMILGHVKPHNGAPSEEAALMQTTVDLFDGENDRAHGFPGVGSRRASAQSLSQEEVPLKGSPVWVRVVPANGGQSSGPPAGLFLQLSAGSGPGSLATLDPPAGKFQ